MRPRPSLLILLLLTLAVYAAAQQRGNSASRRRGSLTIHIVLPNDRHLNDERVRVQVLSAGGTPIAERFTSGATEAQFAGLAPGSYQVHVSGLGIEDTTTTIDLSAFEGDHIEFVRVTPSSAAPNHPMGSAQGTISAHVLNIPEKARKELDQGNDAVRHQKWQAAQAHYRKAIEVFPSYSNAYNNLGVVCTEVKDFACARDSWEKATSLDPQNARAFVNLGRLRMAENDYGRAEPLLQKAVSVEPLNPEGMLLLANAELMLGHYDEALLYARKVHTIPHKPFAATHLIAGNALEAEHKFDEAAEEYRTMLQESPDGPAAARAREGLQRLHQPTVAKHE